MKRKLIKGLSVSMLIVSAFMLGKANTTSKKQVKVTNILHESTKEFKIEEGEIGIELSDGSWASINESKNYYIFQPVNMGDWEYNCNSLEELKKIINTYMENSNQDL